MQAQRACTKCGAELAADAEGTLCNKCSFLDAVFGSGESSLTELETREQLVAENPVKIGRYKLLQQIGEGGCGVVYMAEQEIPVRRRVALKVIKPGMDTREVLARFEAERQALALMDHPNIAKVLDAGAAENGRPYFVMELVQGIKVTDYCDQNSLATRQRLEIFVQICKAVQHAHQKGIIHRDIKPSNILVSLLDGMPVPKIIDFGIAKATAGQTLTDKTIFTAFEQFIGTPAYMSPEQAEMSPLDIDTRSDIYSLGVLLYELLTGRPPFDQLELLKAGLEGMRRIIREREPQRPSARLSTLAAAEQTTVARRRRSEAPRLIHLIRGDLDWVVMKALEKDRTRRYETANGFASDIARFLSNEPILARPPSSAYRLWKFARRHRTELVVAGTVTLLLVAGSIASAWLAYRATRAEGAQRQLRQGAEMARASEKIAREQAERKSQELAETLSQLEQQQLDAVATKESPAKLLAYLAAALRRNSDNYRAAYRLMSMLSFNDIARFVRQKKYDSQILGSCFCSLGPLIVSMDRDRNLWLWDFNQNQPLAGPLAPGGAVTRVEFSNTGNYFFTTLQDGRISIWETSRKAPLVGYLSPGAADNRFSISPDESLAVTESWLATENTTVLRLWDIHNGQPLGSPISIKSGRFRGVEATFRRDSRAVTITDTSGSNQEVSVSVLDVATGRLSPPRIVPWSDQMADTDFIGEQRYMRAEAGWDPGYLTFKASIGGRRVLIPPLMQVVSGIQKNISPDGTQFLAPRADGIVNLWDISRRSIVSGRVAFGSSAAQDPKSDGQTQFAELSGDGKRLLTLDRNGILVVREAMGGRVVVGPLVGSLSAKKARLSPDGQIVAAFHADGGLRIWNTSTGKPLTIKFRDDQASQPSAAQPGLAYICFDKKSSRAAAERDDGLTQVWDARSGHEFACIPTGGSPGLSPGFSPDGKRLATFRDRTARIWDPETGSPITNPLRQGEALTCYDFSTDGTRLACGSSDKTVCVWNTDTGAQVLPPLRHDAAVVHAQFGPKNTLTTLSADQTARVWGLAGGLILSRFKLPEDSGFWNYNRGGPFCLSSDNSLLVVLETSELARSKFASSRSTGLEEYRSSSGQFRIWDMTTGTRLSEPMFDVFPYPVQRFCFTDSTHLAIFSGDSVRVLDLPQISARVPDWLPELAETLAGLKMTPQGPEELDTAAHFPALRDSIRAHPSAGPFGDWAKWFFAEASDVTVSPFSDVSVAERERAGIDANTDQSLREALALEPGNVTALSAYVELRSRIPLPSEPAVAWIPAEGQRRMEIRSRGWQEERLAEALLARIPENGPAWHLKAKALYKLEEYLEGLQALQHIEASQMRPAYWNTKALILEKLSRFDEATIVSSNAITQASQENADIGFYYLQRSEFLRRQNRLPEAASDACIGRGIPIREPDRQSGLIDLSLLYTTSLTNLNLAGASANALQELPVGANKIGNIQFDIRGTMIGRKHLMFLPGTEPMSIPVNLHCRSLRFLHGCATTTSTDAQSVAKFTVRCAGQQAQEVPVVFGKDVGSWIYNQDEVVEAENAPVVWVGLDPSSRTSDGKFIRLYEMLWTNPFPSSLVESIAFEATADATCFLLAITADQIQDEVSRVASVAESSMSVAEQTLQTVEKGLSNHPDHSGLKLAKAKLLARLRRTDEAVKVLDALVAQSQTSGAQNDLPLAAVLRHRAQLFLNLQRWKDAAGDYRRIVSVRPEEHWSWCELGPLLVQTGALADYDSMRDSMLRRFGSTQVDYIAERTTKACLLTPLAPSSLAKAEELAERAVTLGKDSGWLSYFQFAKALAAYRTGHFASAAELAKSDLSGFGGTVPFLAAQCNLVLAMAQHKGHQTEEARASLRKAMELIDTKLALPEPGHAPENAGWHDILTAQILLREAKQTLGWHEG